MKNYIRAILLAGAASTVVANAEVDCLATSQKVSLELSQDLSNLLEIVSKEVSASPGCACEIVKAAIKASDAKPETVGSIVEAAVTASPENLRLISQCAIATAPGSAKQVQAILAKLDPNSGDSVSSAKSGKDAVASETPENFNPLDFPVGQGGNTVGPQAGTNGGNALTSFVGGPLNFPNSSDGIVPGPVTDPNPVMIETAPLQ